MIRIVLTVPGTALRTGLRSMLETDPGLHVIRASEQVDMLDQADVWVVSERVSADEIHQEIVSAKTDVALLILGDGEHSLQIYLNLPVRAWGIIPVDATVDEMTAAVRALDAGLVVMYPEWMGWPMPHRLSASTVETEKLVEPLTERETEVLQWLTHGLSNKQIAVRLHISEHTVKFHVSSIYGKLGATNRAEAVRLGAQQGLVVF